jgi:hypothetical protein
MLARFVIVSTLMMQAACHLLVAPFLMARGLEKRDYPPKVIEDPDYDFGEMIRRGGSLYMWIHSPDWDRVTAEWSDGDYQVSRVTTNHPMIEVFIDTSPRCRWRYMRFRQRRIGIDASPDFSSSDSYSVFSDDAKQFAGDCKKLKALLADDPRYAEVLAKL